MFFDTDLLWKIRLYAWPCGHPSFLYILLTYPRMIRPLGDTFWHLSRCQSACLTFASSISGIHLEFCIKRIHNNITIRCVFSKLYLPFFSRRDGQETCSLLSITISSLSLARWRYTFLERLVSWDRVWPGYLRLAVQLRITLTSASCLQESSWVHTTKLSATSLPFLKDTLWFIMFCWNRLTFPTLHLSFIVFSYLRMLILLFELPIFLSWDITGLFLLKYAVV